MKTIYYITDILKSRINFNLIEGVRCWFILMLVTGAFSLQSCDNDDIGGNFYTFEENLIGEFLQKNPAEYSEFCKLLDTTHIMGLLKAYGKYTVFAPTNAAMAGYYKSKGRGSYLEFPYDSVVIMVKNHIIKDMIFPSTNFVNGTVPYVSMNDRFISSKITLNTQGQPVVVLNNNSQILKEDSAQNGLVYTVSEVFQPSDLRLPDKLAIDPRFSLFSMALNLTGLDKLIVAFKDESFKPDAEWKKWNSQWGGYTVEMMETPQNRYYGYTVLCESDSTFNAYGSGIKNINDLKVLAKTIYDPMYPNDKDIEDVTDRRNSLNRFIAYHILDKKVVYSKFLNDIVHCGYDGEKATGKAAHIKSYDAFEYYETLCPNTLIECRSDEDQDDWWGIFNYTSKAGKGIRIIKENSDIEAVNGYYHEIDGILSYNLDVLNEISGKRIRMDFAAFFPELTNNNMRLCFRGVQFIIPNNYLANLKAVNTEAVWYIPSKDKLMDYQEDEFFVVGKDYKKTIAFDITFTTLPIPSGKYEVRVGYLTNDVRGVVQFYLDDKACGIPLDMNPKSDSYQIGYVKPGTDPSDLEGFDNDRMMHNRGYMKGPASFYAIDGTWSGSAVSARMDPRSIRNVLGIVDWSEDGKHKLRMKSTESIGQLELDWIEFVPVDYLDREGID